MSKQLVPLVLATILSLSFISVGSYKLYHTYIDISNGIKITGHVIGHEDIRIGSIKSRRIVKTPVIEFTSPDGVTKRFTKRSWESWAPNYRVNDSVTVFYPLNAPQRVAPYSIFNLFVAPIALIISGCLVFFSFFIFPPIQKRMRRSHAERLHSTGIRISAEVCASKKGQAFGNIHYFSIEATAEDTHTKQKRLFESDPLPYDPSDVIKKGSAIDVYIDPSNANDYWVDVSSSQKSKE